MFVALETVNAEESGIFGNILNILTKPKARLETREAFGAVYGVIIAAKPLRTADWRRITELAGRYADRMLLPDGLEAPPPISEPAFSRFERTVMLKTAVEIIKRTRMPMYRRVVGLVDETGEYADLLFPLLHHYTAAKVLTKKTSLYLGQAEKMMDELGAPVILCDGYQSLSDCVLTIAPDGISAAQKLACPVLAKKPPQSTQYGDFITDLQVVPAPEAAALCPNGIEPHKFFAALYECCGVEEVAVPAARMMWRYAKSDLTQVVLAVLQTPGAL